MCTAALRNVRRGAAGSHAASNLWTNALCASARPVRWSWAHLSPVWAFGCDLEDSERPCLAALSSRISTAPRQVNGAVPPERGEPALFYPGRVHLHAGDAEEEVSSFHSMAETVLPLHPDFPSLTTFSNALSPSLACARVLSRAKDVLIPSSKCEKTLRSPGYKSQTVDDDVACLYTAKEDQYEPTGRNRAVPA